MLLVYLAAGGLIGTLLRYAAGGWIHSWAGSTMPWGTLAINVIGSLILGFTMRASQTVLLSPETRAFITVGLCGAFTTFSTYTYETVTLLQKGEWLRAMSYALGSLLLGVLAVLAGFAAAARLLRAGG